jgi:hypothetical protein
VRDVLVAVTHAAASGVTAAACAAGALVLVRTRRPAAALPVLLDLLLAAGLLRLAGDPDWRTIATAAAIVALRRLIGIGLRVGGRSWSAGGTGGAARDAVTALRAGAGRVLLRPAWRR